MSIVNSKVRRQHRRNHSKSTGGKMSDTATKPAEKVEKPFSKAQLRHFNELQANAQRAQVELQTFVNYLSDELEIGDAPEGHAWTIGPKGFEARPSGTPLPPDANDGAGGETGQTPQE